MQGAEAYERKDYATAQDRFERASALFRAPSITVMAARSLVALGRFLEALDKYEETQHMPLPPDAPDAFQKAVSDAQKEAKSVRARLPLLKIQTLGAASRDKGFRVTLDGKPVPAPLLDVERPLDPGQHRVKASAPGFSDFEKSFAVEEAAHVVVEVPFAAAPADRDGAARAFTSKQILGYGLLGVGAVGLGTSLVTGILALNHHSHLSDSCHPGCPPSAAQDLSAFRTDRTLSYVSLAVGVSAASIGGYLVLAGEPQAEHIGAALSPGGVELRGRF